MSPAAFESHEIGTLPSSTCHWTHLLVHRVLPGSPLRAPGPGQTPHRHTEAPRAPHGGARGHPRENGRSPGPTASRPRLSLREMTLTTCLSGICPQAPPSGTRPVDKPPGLTTETRLAGPGFSAASSAAARGPGGREGPGRTPQAPGAGAGGLGRTGTSSLCAQLPCLSPRQPQVSATWLPSPLSWTRGRVRSH